MNNATSFDDNLTKFNDCNFLQAFLHFILISLELMLLHKVFSSVKQPRSLIFIVFAQAVECTIYYLTFTQILFKINIRIVPLHCVKQCCHILCIELFYISIYQLYHHHQHFFLSQQQDSELTQYFT